MDIRLNLRSQTCIICFFCAGAFTDDAFDDCLEPVDSLNVSLEKLPSVVVKHLQSPSTNGNYTTVCTLSYWHVTSACLLLDALSKL